MKLNLNKYKVTLPFLMLLLVGLFSFSSCTKEHNKFYNYVNHIKKFQGSTMDFLKSQGKYDSMLLVLHRVTGVIDSLNKDTITVFALPNQCFQNVIKNMNSLRATEGKSPLYLSTVDSSQLDTLICRYIFKGFYPTDSITYIDGRNLISLKYGYPMNVKPIQVNASGFVNGGPKNLQFSDMKGSRYVRNWVITNTQAVDIFTTTGVVHVLSANHNFGFQEFIKRMSK